ncbi:MAG: carboxypeptidase-like regulatory domain-containing protein [Gemmatimonadaceae bacterium]
MRLGGRYRTAALIAALTVVSACHKHTHEDLQLMTTGCSTRGHAKGPQPRLPRAPTLKSGFGGVVGTVADAGGALPHYSVLATTPGNSFRASRASVVADSSGGFVFDGLTPGAYRLLVQPYNHRPDSTDIKISAGQVDTVELRPSFFGCVS